MTNGVRGVVLALPLALAACGSADVPPDNVSTVGQAPMGLNDADTSGDRTDSLKFGDNTMAGGDRRVDKLGTGAGSQSDAGSIEGGTQNPDAAAPTGE